jgi:hypothetical protein
MTFRDLGSLARRTLSEIAEVAGTPRGEAPARRRHDGE